MILPGRNNPYVKALVRWATGERLTDRLLPKLSLVTQGCAFSWIIKTINVLTPKSSQSIIDFTHSYSLWCTRYNSMSYMPRPWHRNVYRVALSCSQPLCGTICTNNSIELLTRVTCLSKTPQEILGASPVSCRCRVLTTTTTATKNSLVFLSSFVSPKR